MNIADLFSREDRDQLEKWCRAHTQQAYLGKHLALCRVLGKYLMYVDTRDESLAPHLLMNGFWEMWVTIAIARYVKPGMRCIDVGANFGYYTMLLADLVGDRGEVSAYEPQNQAPGSPLDLLARSSRLNGFSDRVIWSGYAVGAAEAATEIWTAGKLPNETGSAILMGSATLKQQSGFVKGGRIGVVSLDKDYLRSPDFVKIDVQGCEMEVLRGMKETIARSPGIAIAMEFTPKEHEKPIEALTEIRDGMGLTIRAVGADGLLRPIEIAQALNPDTGDHRMLWLTRTQ